MAHCDKSKLSILTALAITLGAGAGIAAAAKNAAPPHAITNQNASSGQIEIWKLKQESQITGGHTVYVSSDAVKDINERSGMIVICKAPDWKVISFQPSAKCMFSQDLNRFSGYLQNELALFSGRTLNHIEVKAKKKSTFLSQEAVEYSTTTAFTNKVMQDFSKNLTEGSYPAVVKMEALNIPAVKQAEMLCKVHGLPRVPSLPLSCESVSADQFTRHILTTSTLSKSKVAATFFDVPRGLKPVATMAEVVHPANAENDQGLMELMEQKTTFDKTPAPGRK